MDCASRFMPKVSESTTSVTIQQVRCAQNNKRFTIEGFANIRHLLNAVKIFVVFTKNNNSSSFWACFQLEKLSAILSLYLTLAELTFLIERSVIQAKKRKGDKK